MSLRVCSCRSRFQPRTTRPTPGFRGCFHPRPAPTSQVILHLSLSISNSSRPTSPSNASALPTCPSSPDGWASLLTWVAHPLDCRFSKGAAFDFVLSTTRIARFACKIKMLQMPLSRQFFCTPHKQQNIPDPPLPLPSCPCPRYSTIQYH